MKNKKILYHVLIPMFIGSLIYILFRDKTILMFHWFKTMGLDNYIDLLRVSVISKNQIPNWVLYSLPDGIWVYSLTSLMLIIWYKELNKSKYFWMSIGPLLAVLAELGQKINIIAGTYSHTDLVFCLIGSVLPYYIMIYNNK